ncbi:MAG: hypothetical protein ACRBFS_01010 [Aureispira sp.]
MEMKIKKLDSLEKLDYGAYEKLLRKSLPELLESPEASFGYALVEGQHLLWKNTKPKEKDKQPLLYIGPITKWKTELSSSSSIDLKGYSYGECKVVPVGKAVHVYLNPAKGKLTDEKLLKPIKKVLKGFKPKVFLEVVADLDAVEIVTEQPVSEDTGQDLPKVVHELRKELEKYDTAAKKIKKNISTLKPEEQAKLQVKYQQILRRLKHLSADWKEQIVPSREEVNQEKNYKEGQKIYEEWQDFFERRKAAKEGRGNEQDNTIEEERLYGKLASNIQQFYTNIEKGELLDVDLIETNISNLKNYYGRWQQFVKGKKSAFAEELQAAKALLTDILQSWPTIKPLLSRSVELYATLETAAQSGDAETLLSVLKELEQIDEKLKTL